MKTTTDRVNNEIVAWYRQSRAGRNERAPFKRAQVLSSGSVYFDVVLDKVSGTNGTDAAPNTFSYDIYDDGGTGDSGNLIEAAVQFNSGSRHEYTTFNLGEITEATWGRAYFNDQDQVVVVMTNEQLLLQACEESDGGAGGTGTATAFTTPTNIVSRNLVIITDYRAVFNGSTSEIDLDNPSPLQITDNLTITAWVKIDSIPLDMAVFSKWETTGNQRGYYLLGEDTSDRLQWYVSGNGTSAVYVEAVSDIRDSAWHFIAVTYTPSTSIKIYIDGVLDNTNSTSIPSSLHNSTANAFIGSRNGSTHYWNGEIRDVQVFNRTLSDFEIWDMYRGQVPVSAPVGRWIRSAADAKDMSTADNNLDGTSTDVTFSVYPY